MADDLISSFRISAAGMKVQGERLRVISQNIANSDSLPTEPGQNPYQRKTITFKNALDRDLDMKLVEVSRIGKDRSDFVKKYDPNHPAADKQGYVLAPNINKLVEMMDMREAQRSYEANLSAIRTSRAMLNKTLELLR
ncbi:MAG: flagellar basal body rod protein FlgC [Rhodospirillaceae bacterium]|jgi:flagellar basal-body rod protein FlgC|nr:flagellar basal body rod protein FlgC [Rhodospirillaceae bacterium]MBT4588478.1 flagellar basal body rod protein FlgC [Rhodospirillaceae bacterium]MBT4940703.1 flagellar basal body rod protein FlgC [Rhodospirillaceae bacterium]MBT5938597.1 flagellar basal body rod protein FlgC [Rhodospirillaceae bacterium]MBT7265730.1 flagellar basal body rod protein FlgC [Rhodospirillaceae bacterium]